MCWICWQKNQKICSKQFDPVFEYPPVAIFELKVLDGRIVTPKKKFKWSVLPRHLTQNISEEKKIQLKTRTIFRVGIFNNYLFCYLWPFNVINMRIDWIIN